MTWDEYYAAECITASKKSKDPSTKVGAAIVGPDNEIRSKGWNGFPRGVDDHPDRYNDRPLKYKLVAHGELNAICNANRSGTILKGCTLYVYPFFPCNECAKLIIQVGIVEVVIVSEKPPVGWEEKVSIAKLMFDEAGVKYRFIDIKGNPISEAPKELPYVSIQTGDERVGLPSEIPCYRLYDCFKHLHRRPKEPFTVYLERPGGLDLAIPDSDMIIQLHTNDRFYAVHNYINGG